MPVRWSAPIALRYSASIRAWAHTKLIRRIVLTAIRVGGATEVEVKERKDRVDDAMHATRAAVEEGIVPGGGVALLRASEHLKGLRTKNDAQKTGVAIVRTAWSYPARHIAI